MKPDRSTIGRFAPSPTGPLHFGSLIAAVGSYCLAKQGGGNWLVRMEDIDTPRVIDGCDSLILNTLEQLGFEWDGEIIYQSKRTERYQQILDDLTERGLVFGCACSRKEILASAPHPGEEGPIYPGICREGVPHGKKPRAYRLKVPEDIVGYCDGLHGEREQHLATAVGDFVLKRADGLFAYQLAVVVDDIDSGINQLVRGADLIGSTPRQIYLYSCLGETAPHYIHLPIALSPEGEKISKRHLSLDDHQPEQMFDLLFDSFIFLGQNPPKGLRGAGKELLGWGVVHFNLDLVPQNDRIFSREQHQHIDTQER